MPDLTRMWVKDFNNNTNICLFQLNRNRRIQMLKNTRSEWKWPEPTRLPPRDLTKLCSDTAAPEKDWNWYKMKFLQQSRVKYKYFLSFYFLQFDIHWSGWKLNILSDGRRGLEEITWHWRSFVPSRRSIPWLFAKAHKFSTSFSAFVSPLNWRLSVLSVHHMMSCRRNVNRIFMFTDRESSNFLF